MTYPVPSIPCLTTLKELSNTYALPIYLVGGALRDTLLQHPCRDFDLITPGDPTPIAQKLAKRQSGHWFWLDRQRLYSRVILKSDETTLQYDFAPFRADTLPDDLRLRDFTINAMACALDGLDQWVDPLAGKQDLENRLLRECSPQSFPDDPLRMLKGIRHCAQFELSVEDTTWRHCQKYAAQLSQVAGERIRQELALLFAQNSLLAALRLFHQSGLPQALGLPDMTLEPALPPIDHGYLSHVFPQAACRFDQGLCDEFTLKSMSNFCRYIGGLKADFYKIDELLAALKLSRKGTLLVAFFHRLLRTDSKILHQQETTDRMRLLWLEDLHAPLPEALLMLGVVERRAAMQSCWRRLYEQCDALLANGRVRPLVSGTRLKELCPDLPGQELGNVLRMLRLIELKGKIATAQQAEDYLIQWCESH
jgi:tRNA nucleotidyltransferase/poly(A) polymerase